MLIHGTSSRWNIPREAQSAIWEEQLCWTAHSHPTTMDLKASDEDRSTLKQFTWQNKSSIIDLTGKIKAFTKREVDDMNERFGIKNDYNKTGKRNGNR